MPAPTVIRNPRGGTVTVYSVRVSWLDPRAGQLNGRRDYTFAGRRARAFEHQFHPGAQVPIVYPPTRPNRFVIDVPYAPTMADQFL